MLESTNIISEENFTPFFRRFDSTNVVCMPKLFNRSVCPDIIISY